MEHKAQHSGNSKREGIYAGGIDSTVGDGSLAKEFITAADSVEEAFAKTIFRDENHLNSALALHRKLVKFHNAAGLDTFLNKLNGLPAVGGYNRATSALVGTGVIYPEAMGVHLSKDSKKFVEKQVLARASRSNGHQEGQNE